MRARLAAKVYLRGHGPRQTGQQFDEIRRFAARHGIRLARQLTFVDEGCSGRSISGRPAMQRLLEAVENGDFRRLDADTLLVRALDRLGKSVFDVLRITRTLAANGVRLRTAMDHRQADSRAHGFSFVADAMVKLLRCGTGVVRRVGRRQGGAS